jgi:hypothetical protein
MKTSRNFSSIGSKVTKISISHLSGYTGSPAVAGVRIAATDARLVKRRNRAVLLSCTAFPECIPGVSLIHLGGMRRARLTVFSAESVPWLARRNLTYLVWYLPPLVSPVPRQA